MLALAGTAHARFSDFGYSPNEAIRYVKESLRGSPRHYTGHNPAGSWAVYLLLAGVLVTCVTGIVALGAMFGMGPWLLPLTPPTTDFMREAHEWLAWALLALIAGFGVTAAAVLAALSSGAPVRMAAAANTEAIVFIFPPWRGPVMNRGQERL